MLCCIVEIAMLVIGIMALVTGKLTFSQNKVVRGATARIAGAILMIPLPLMFGIGLIIGLQAGLQGQQVDQQKLQSQLTPIEIGVTITCLILGLGIAVMGAEPPRRRDDFDDYHDDPYRDHP
jgi:hypothetical protein